MAIRRLVTVLSRVSRAPGAVWPTLLVTMILVKTGFGRKANVSCLCLQTDSFMTLEGNRLEANRTCENDRFSADVSVRVSAAPFTLGRLLISRRLLVSMAVKVSCILCVPLSRILPIRVTVVGRVLRVVSVRGGVVRVLEVSVFGWLATGTGLGRRSTGVVVLVRGSWMTCECMLWLSAAGD